MTTIFMSHCTTDDDFTNKLSAELGMRGYQTWVDHVNIPPGESWTRVVEQALQQCEAMVLVLSEDARASRHVNTEWHAFYDQNKPIFPVMIRQTTKPMLLSLLQHIDFTNPENYAQQLAVLLEVLPQPTQSAEPVQVAVERKRITDHTAPFNPDTIQEALRITQIMDTLGPTPEKEMEVKEREVLFVFPKFDQTQLYRIDQPLIIGWSHPSVRGKPDVDLTPFEPQRHGISRRHAMLVNTTIGLTLTDLSSRNGTFVGTQQLTPNQPVRVANKAVIRFGGLVTQIHFKVD